MKAFVAGPAGGSGSLAGPGLGEVCRHFEPMVTLLQPHKPGKKSGEVMLYRF